MVSDLFNFFSLKKNPTCSLKTGTIYIRLQNQAKKNEWTKERVEEILKENDYNMTKAAKTIGNTKQFISFLAKKFGIKKPSKA
jgi:transcriptional regulator with GAF, ATPase, and Fis domain